MPISNVASDVGIEQTSEEGPVAQDDISWRGTVFGPVQDSAIKCAVSTEGLVFIISKEVEYLEGGIGGREEKLGDLGARVSCEAGYSGRHLSRSAIPRCRPGLTSKCDQGNKERVHVVQNEV